MFCSPFQLSQKPWSISCPSPASSGTAQLEVGAEHTAPFVGSGRIAVLATPVMINIIEAAALNAIKHLLPAGHSYALPAAVLRLARIVNSRGNVSCSPLLRQHAEQHAVAAYRHVPAGRPNMEDYDGIS